MKVISEYQIIDHDLENSQYFQGCGVSFTDFDQVSTGIGNSAFEALEDALDSLAQNDWIVDSIKNELSKEDSVPENAEDCYHYVSIRVKAGALSQPIKID